MGVVVRDDAGRESIVGKYVSSIKFGSISGIHCFITGDEDGSFKKVSVMVSVVSYVSDVGSVPIKSMAIDVNGVE